MLRFRFLVVLLLLGAFTLPVMAQDGLNLPTELYTLLNEGRVERYGLGASGVARVTSDDEVVIDFGVAPDGIWMAYRTEAGLTTRNMRSDEVRQIEGTTAGIPPFRGRGQTIAWSRDGAVLAYTTEYGVRFAFEDGAFFDIGIMPLLHLTWSPDSRFLAAEAENNIWWIYRREGNQMILTSAIPSSIGLDWVGNGLLMFAPEPGGLFLMDVSNGNAQSQLSDENTLFRLPVYRQDGAVSIFAKPANDSTLSATSGYLYRVNPGDAVSLEQVSQTAVDLDGLRWSPGGVLLLALRGGVLALVDPVSGQGFTLPVTGVATYGWGGLRPVSVPSLSLSASGYFIADDGTGVPQLWRLSNDGARSAPMTSVSEPVTAFAVAPDGQTLAYHSEGQLWLLPANAEAATSVLEVEAVNHMTFSADGLSLVYDLEETIYTVPITGGAPEALLTGYSEAQGSPDGSAVLIRLPDGDMGVLLTASGEVRRLGAFEWSKWLSDGRIVSYGAPTGGGQLGIYLNEPTTEAALLYSVPLGLQSVDAALLANGSLRVLQTRSINGPAPIEGVDLPLTGGEPAAPIPLGFINEAKLSPDGRFITGYASGVGLLVTYEVETRQEVLLTNPPGVLVFDWG